MKKYITVSIVLYHTEVIEITKTIRSILSSIKNLTLYLIDNSQNDDLKVLRELDSRINYFHNPSNPGFGAAHNIAIQKAMQVGIKYHFIVNPDIYFEDNVILPMIEYMQKDQSIGMMMPKILNLDGTAQNLPKLLPSPLSILLRKVKKPTFIYQKFINFYELRQVAEDSIYNAPILSGCFTLLNLDAVKKVGMYDDSFFMYFEDWDLSRRMHNKYKTIYYPLVSVYHGYESGANKSLKLFLIFIQSAFNYFNKWGWFFDNDRKQINKNALSQFE